MDQMYCPYCMTPVKPGEPCPGCGLTEGSYHPQPHHLPPGTMLADRYLLGRVLGEGGFGITYIGCDTRLELRVAVKEYFPGNHVARNCAATLAVTCYDGVAGRGFEKGRERFIREARTMAKMDKTPQIVAVRDFFQENNTAYIVMEYVDGTTFKELVAQRGGGMSAGELLPMVEPLFGALETMHRQGLIHRDISPDNLMLENGMVRLLDFGCARESEKGNETMTIVLKQGYSPVEQYQHKGQGAWTDVYSLAATMYYCLTGKTPPQALDRICDDELIPPRKLGADLTQEQELALLYGMGLQPTRRFRSVREFHAALYQGAPVPLSPRERISPPADTREEKSEPEDAAQMTAPVLPEAREEGEPETGTQMPPEGDAQALQGQELIEEPEEERPARTTAQETEAARPVEASEGSQPKETDGPARETAVKPDRKKLFLIGGAVAAAALILALILIIPRLFAPAGTDVPAADGSQPPAVTFGPLPDDLFDGAAQATNKQEFLNLLADDSVSAIIVPEGREVAIGDNQAVEITKPLRLEPGAAFRTDGVMTVSSTVELMEGARLDQDADFTLTGSGTLYIGQGAYAHVSNRGEGRCDIAGAVQVSQDGDLWLNGAASAVSGTVRVNGGGFAGFGGFTTVSGTGCLEINGSGHSGHVVRTVDGGSVTVGGDGWMNFNVLWLEKNTDLNAAGDRIGLDQARYIVADADVFDNAAHVNSFGELEQAVNDRLVPAIVIDSGFEMEYGLSIGKPVLIREDVELRAGDNGKTLSFSGGVIVNYGSVTGFMNLDGQCVYLNYGSTDVSVWTNGGENYLLNMGELNYQYGQYVNATIINLGRMRHETYGGEDANYLDLVGTMVENLGEFTICSGNRMWVGSGYFENNGELLIEDNALLENNGHIGGGGLLRVRGVLENSAGVLEIGDPSQLSIEGGRVEGGIIQTGGAGFTLENDENITSQVLTQWNEPSALVEVSSADELMAALSGGGPTAIRVTGEITVDGDLNLGQDLIIDGGARLNAAGHLTVTGKTLYVRGALEANELTILGGGQLQLHGGGVIETGSLTLEDSSGFIWGDLAADSVLLNNALLINWNNMLRCGELTLDGGSHFYDAANLELAENARITLTDGAFTDRNWLHMNGGEITIKERGVMRLKGGANLGGDLAITNEGGFEASLCNFYLNEGTITVNFGWMNINSWDWQDVQLNGLFVNRRGGYLSLSGAPNINYRLDNEGELEIGWGILRINGEVNNNGTAFTYDREAGWQGNWTGRNLEYR